MAYLFTSESVSEGHPDKVSDQISDALVDEFLRRDPLSKVACETLVTTGLVILAGEVRTTGYVDVQQTARNVINDIGYSRAEYKFDGGSCGVISTIHEQSPDINQGVVRENADEQGAGDQGMMFGFATRETAEFMPMGISLAHLFMEELAKIRHEGKQMTYLRPDSKSQVTLQYNDQKQPVALKTLVISTQHDEFPSETIMQREIAKDIKDILIPRVLEHITPEERKIFNSDFRLLVNPTGKFVIGGPHGDTGLTGRKIIVDTYGGRCGHGGGAFSGKDSSKVDRSATYAARHIAKNIVAAGIASEVEIQISYAIGIAQPLSVMVNTRGTSVLKISDSELGERIRDIFDLRPSKIVTRFGLLYPIFRPTASYGHFGRKPYEAPVELLYNGEARTENVTFFGWEKLDYVDILQREFTL